MSEQKLLDEVLTRALEVGASDVHFVACAPIRMRVAGELRLYQSPYPSPEQTRAMAVSILARARPHQVDADDVPAALLEDQDCPYSLPGVGRFRANIFTQRGTTALVLRSIPVKIPTIEEIGLPEVVDDIALEPRGLVLVTGMAGAGKSTTVAAMLNHMNIHRHCRIMTIEDPIEYVFRDGAASIVQREVGSDTRTFATALATVMRQDPDVVFVGEIRDADTVGVVLRASESGCLVLSTMHTADAPKSIHALLSFFEPAQQPSVRVRIADSLKAVISQRLLPRQGGTGRLPVVEVMRTNPAVRAAILNPDKVQTMRDYIAIGRVELGMQTRDQHLLELIEAGELDPAVALAAATNPVEMERRLQVLQPV